ncbi:MAG: uracil-DNA glycosylase [Candidatus Aminicenantes bacterium]|nr:uracil-DNA glycosylase [Candidatus Aminicenantes bacterium]
MSELKEILKFYREIGASFLEHHREDPLTALKEVSSEIHKCTKCPLHQKKKNYVPGEGSPEPDIMFIGEGPGETEDNFGRPFVGNAGQLLDKIIEKMGYSRETVFIGNIVKCRPPGNRDPEPGEVAACKPYLEKQVAILKPRVIVCLGRVALNNLLGQELSITNERGKLFYFNDIPVIPTYHPAYILRQKTKEAASKAKWDTWNDMLKVLEIAGKS